MRISAIVLVAASLFLPGPVARADSFGFQVKGGGSFSVFLSGSTVYTTGVDGPGTTSTVFIDTSVESGGFLGGFGNLIPGFIAPAGSVITSATVEFTFLLPETGVEAVGIETVAASSPTLPPPDPNDPKSIAPTFINTSNFFGAVSVGNIVSMDGVVGINVFDFPAVIGPGPAGSGGVADGIFGNITFEASDTSAIAFIDTQGYNWAGFIDTQAQADIGFTETVTGTYAFTPEPSSFVLFGTGMALLAGFVRHRRASSC